MEVKIITIITPTTNTTNTIQNRLRTPGRVLLIIWLFRVIRHTIKHTPPVVRRCFLGQWLKNAVFVPRLSNSDNVAYQNLAFQQSTPHRQIPFVIMPKGTVAVWLPIIPPVTLERITNEV